MNFNIKLVIQLYLETILEIIEDKPPFIIPVYFYCFLIWVYYHQIAGYIFSHFEAKSITEEKWGYIAYLNEVSPVTFLLYMKVFFTPYIEINSGIIVCGGNSFLSVYREDTDCSRKPSWQITLGYIGISLTLITGMVVIFFFRNYEFDEKNVLKRRFNFLLIMQLFTRFMMTFLYYLNINIVLVFKHIAAQFVGLSLIYDIIGNWPFRHPTICKFYIAATLCLFWIFIYDLDDSSLFYWWLLAGVLISGAIIGLWDYKYNKIMEINDDNFKNYYKHLDFFLEEIYRLAKESERDGQAKFRLFKILKIHAKFCNNMKCQCKFTNFILPETGDVNINQIHEMIVNIFTYYLNNPILENNRDEFEHVSLKFISFLSKIINNPFRAYYELKAILAKRKGISNYFHQISKIMSLTIQTQIELINRDKSDTSNNDLSGELNLESLHQIENLKNQYIPMFQNYMNEKSNIWQKIRKGYQSFDEFIADGVKFATQGLEIKQKFEKTINSHANNKFHIKNMVYFKLQSMYQTVVLNRLNKAQKIEAAAVELYKQDLSKQKNIVTNYMFLKGFVEHFRISLCKERGKLISKKTIKQSNMFSYNHTRFEGIVKVQELMPEFLGRLHDEFISNLIRRGSSLIMKKKQLTFGADQRGFIFPINIYVDSCYEYFDDFCVQATILKTETSDEHIILNSDGKLLGISHKIYDQLFSRTQATQNFQINLTKTNYQNQFNKSMAPTSGYKSTQVAQSTINKSRAPSAMSKGSNSRREKNEDHKNYILSIEELKTVNFQLFMPHFVEQIKENIDDFDFKQASGYICQNKRCEFVITKLFNQIWQNYFSFLQQEQYENDIDLTQEEHLKSFYQFYKDNKNMYMINPKFKNMTLAYNLSYHTYYYGEDQSKFVRIFEMTVKEIIVNNDVPLNDTEKMLYNQYDSTTVANTVNTKKSKFEINSIDDGNDQFDEEGNQEMTQEDKRAIKLMSYQPSTEMFQTKDSYHSEMMGHTNYEASENAAKKTNLKQSQFQSQNSFLAAGTVQNKDYLDQLKGSSKMDSKEEVNIANYLQNGIPSSLVQGLDANCQEIQDNHSNGQMQNNENKLARIHEDENENNETIHKKGSMAYEQNEAEENGELFDKDEIENDYYDQQNKNNNLDVHAKSNHPSQLQSMSDFNDENEDKKKQQKNENKKNPQMRGSQQQNSIRSNQTLTDTIQDQVLDQLVRQCILPGPFYNFKNLVYLFLFIYVVLLVISIIIMNIEFQGYRSVQSTGQIPSKMITYISQGTIAGIYLLEREYKFVNLDQAKDELFNDIMLSYLKSSVQQYDKLFEENVNYFITIDKNDDKFLVSQHSQHQKITYHLKLFEFSHLYVDNFRQIIANFNNKVYEPPISIDKSADPIKDTRNNVNENIHFLIDNYEKMSKQILKIIKKTKNDVEKEEKEILIVFIIFAIISFVIFFSILLSSIPVFKSLMAYQEKILMLICRTYEYETYVEQKRIQNFSSIINDPLEEWMKEDFINLMTQDVQVENIKESKKQQMISTKIDNQKLSFAKYVLMLFIACLLGSMFFSILIVIFLSVKEKMSYAILLNSNSFESNHNFNNLIVEAELMATQDRFEFTSTEYPFVSPEEMILTFKSSLDFLQNYLHEFQNNLKKVTIFSQSQKQKMTDLLQYRICKHIKCPPNTPEVFNEGLVTILSTYFQTFNTNEKLFFSTELVPFKQLQFYLDQDEHQQLFYKGHQIPVQALMELSEMIRTECKNYITTAIFINYLYLIILGCVFGGLLIIMGIKLINLMKRRIRSVNFLLSIVPVEKWSEEATSQMLKSIYKISV